LPRGPQNFFWGTGKVTAPTGPFVAIEHPFSGTVNRRPFEGRRTRAEFFLLELTLFFHARSWGRASRREPSSNPRLGQTNWVFLFPQRRFVGFCWFLLRRFPRFPLRQHVLKPWRLFSVRARDSLFPRLCLFPAWLPPQDFTFFLQRTAASALLSSSRIAGPCLGTCDSSVFCGPGEALLERSLVLMRAGMAPFFFSFFDAGRILPRISGCWAACPFFFRDGRPPHHPFPSRAVWIQARPAFDDPLFTFLFFWDKKTEGVIALFFPLSSTIVFRLEEIFPDRR